MQGAAILAIIAIITTLQLISSRASAQILASSESSNSSNSVYGLYQCRGDLSLSDCSECVTYTLGSVRSPSHCGGFLSRGGRVHLRGCFVRYESYNFFINISTDGTAAPKCMGHANESSQLYKRNLASALRASATAAPQHPLFGYDATSVGSGFATAYVLTQCLGYLNPSQCATCLSSLVSNNIKDCNGSVSGQVYSVDHCYYLFGNTPLVFTYSNAIAPAISPAPADLPLAERGRAKIHKAAIAGIVLGIVVLIAIIAALVLCFLKRQRKSRTRTFKLEHEQNALLIKARERIFSLKEVEDATDNFNAAKKLGEGGFGPVYQGKLTTGREVAIKMLSSHSRQSKYEFVNEVKLITTVQHRTLIQLLGCCDEDNKQFLVYEYLPNRSLDLRLFDADENNALDWSTRFDIIVGIARGLRYLHEDSPVRIIHRDIKASNILLDNSLVPKIADFGLARLFGDEASHLITRVVGTLGYLAPEYAIGGQLSEKVDVHSFGLVVLEIVSGRRVTKADCGVNKQSLLEWTWVLYEKHQQLQILDEKMQKARKGGLDDGGSMPVNVEEVVRVVHVALLCTQLQPVARPCMSEVYGMLCGQSEILNKPVKPMTIGMLSPFPDLLDDGTSTMFSSSMMPSQLSVSSMYSYDAGPISQVEAR